METDLSALDTLIDTESGGEQGANLITVLQKTQALYGYLPRAAIERIALRLNIKPAKVMGVATFYSQFNMKPEGKYVIQLCCGTACHVNGASGINAAISELLGISDGETTADGMFTLRNAACLGCCSLSPVMTINGEPYGRLTADSVKTIINGFRERAI